MSKATLYSDSGHSGLTSCQLVDFKKEIKVVKGCLTRIRPLCGEWTERSFLP